MDFSADHLGYLRAEANWVPTSRAAEYEDGKIDDLDLGEHAFTNLRVSNVLNRMGDLGRYNYLTNNCQLAAKRMLPGATYYAASWR